MRTVPVQTLAVLVLAAAVSMTDAGDARPAPQSAGPRLLLEPKDLDLGSVIPGQRAVQVVALGNAGNTELEIPLIRTSSPRLSAYLSSARLNPSVTSI